MTISPKARSGKAATARDFGEIYIAGEQAGDGIRIEGHRHSARLVISNSRETMRSIVLISARRGSPNTLRQSRGSATSTRCQRGRGGGRWAEARRGIAAPWSSRREGISL